MLEIAISIPSNRGADVFLKLHERDSCYLTRFGN